MNDVLVLPTCRPEMARHCLDMWQGVSQWDAVVVVEDAPRPTPGLLGRHAGRHVCWADFEKEAPGDAWIFSRRDGAIMTFGWLVAARMGARRIHVLHDDCLPWRGVDVARQHRENLQGVVPHWRSSLPDLRTRGVPYQDTAMEVWPSVGLSMGLWAGVPDLDAVTSLAHGVPTDYVPPPGVRVLARGVYEPFCDMNFAVRRDMLPLLYCPLMGEGQPCGRFEDIWSGMVAKACLDQLDVAMTVGDPVIMHERASDTYANLRKEAGGMEAHEHLWQVVDQAPLRGTTPEAVAGEMAEHLRREAERFPVESFRGYVGRYGEALARWSRLATGPASSPPPLSVLAEDGVPA